MILWLFVVTFCLSIFFVMLLCLSEDALFCSNVSSDTLQPRSEVRAWLCALLKYTYSTMAS